LISGNSGKEAVRELPPRFFTAVPFRIPKQEQLRSEAADGRSLNELFLNERPL